MDPWAGGGVLKVNSKTIKVVLIPEAAHHLDLRATTPIDPLSVIESRKLYKKIIYLWIKEHEINSIIQNV